MANSVDRHHREPFNPVLPPPKPHTIEELRVAVAEALICDSVKEARLLVHDYLAMLQRGVNLGVLKHGPEHVRADIQATIEELRALKKELKARDARAYRGFQ